MAASSRKCPKAFGCYVRGKLLGSGAFANVYACRKSDDEEQIFAVKAVDLHAMRLSGRGERELKKLQREASILKRVRTHANLVQFVDLVEHEDWYLFILEFVPGGNLLQSITKRSEPLKEQEVLCIFRQLLEGLQHLHNEAIIHRDLKLENVLVVQEGSARKEFKIKITDFGLSKEVGDGLSAACSMVGSPKYVAPEVIASGTHDFKADLWSLGILLFVLLGNRFPFDGNVQAAKETQDNVDAELSKLAVSEPARSVLLGLLRIKAEDRTSLEILSSHEWLSSAAPTRALAVGSRVEAHSLATVALNGVYGEVVGFQGDRVTVKFPDGIKAVNPANLRLVQGSPRAKRRKAQAGSSNTTAPKDCLVTTTSPGAAAQLQSPSAGSAEPQVGSSEPACSVAPASPAAIAIATAATPQHPELAPHNRRRSWVDCTPEEAEANFVAQRDKLQRLVARGFDSTMAEIALQSADWNVDTAIMMLEG